MRSGIIAKKVGMTRVFNQNRVHNSVTVLHLPSSIVLGHRKVEKDGYNALVLGFEKVKTKNIATLLYQYCNTQLFYVIKNIQYIYILFCLIYQEGYYLKKKGRL